MLEGQAFPELVHEQRGRLPIPSPSWAYAMRTSAMASASPGEDGGNSRVAATICSGPFGRRHGPGPVAALTGGLSHHAALLLDLDDVARTRAAGSVNSVPGRQT